jgi:hypothetical protein
MGGHQTIDDDLLVREVSVSIVMQDERFEVPKVIGPQDFSQKRIIERVEATELQTREPIEERKRCHEVPEVAQLRDVAQMSDGTRLQCWEKRFDRGLEVDVSSLDESALEDPSVDAEIGLESPLLAESIQKLRFAPEERHSIFFRKAASM